MWEGADPQSGKASGGNEWHRETRQLVLGLWSGKPDRKTQSDAGDFTLVQGCSYYNLGDRKTPPVLSNLDDIEDGVFTRDRRDHRAKTESLSQTFFLGVQ